MFRFRGRREEGVGEGGRATGVRDVFRRCDSFLRRATAIQPILIVRLRSIRFLTVSEIFREGVALGAEEVLMKTMDPRRLLRVFLPTSEMIRVQ